MKKTTAKKTSAKKATAKKTTAKKPPASLTFRELQDKVLKGEITEQELGAYFDEKPSSEDSLEPLFLMNERVTARPDEESHYESALILNTANAWAYQIRKNAYRKKVKTIGPKGIRIVAEGDSWFQYPIKLHDVIDHLADKKEIAVRCFSAAGDVLSNMVARPQFIEAIESEDPHVFLISGGGNDLVAGKGLRLLLHPFKHGRAAKDYPNDNYRALLKRLSRNFADIFRMTRQASSSVRIICHGYDYAIPDSSRGPWLGKPMEHKDIGITDRNLQKQIMNIIVDDINNLIQKAVKDSKDKHIHYVDARGAVPAKGWHDEFHPTSNYYGHVADRFYKKIKSVL